MNVTFSDTAFHRLLGGWLTPAITVVLTFAVSRYVHAEESPTIDSVVLRDDSLTESSGLAWSNRSPHHVWTHNDSGGRAELFAFDTRTGKRTGHCDMPSVRAVDWEAMAAMIDHDGMPKLIVADCGDNRRTREHITLHVIDEPPVQQDVRLTENQIRSLRVRFPGGPMDCEAVAVDTRSEKLWLIGKGFLPHAVVVSVPLASVLSGQETVVAKSAGTLAIPMVTGMDIDRDSGDWWLCSYFNLFHIRPNAAGGNNLNSWRVTVLPTVKLKQIEAVAVAPDDRVWVSSEGVPCRMAVAADAAPSTQPQH
ncbi:esterase-like activity of phytase family protein [Crateriforma conspicua]|uniref:esterase-like activity of phytase family protein n=1 Tax=Crateriforma TaxID=2714592 RepID=UPI0011B8265C|nr:esterase-like activity of phytase family protein [Crateriforma conspicua]